MLDRRHSSTLHHGIAVDVASRNSPNRSLLRQQRAEIFHPLAVDAEVAFAQACRRARGDEVLRRAQVKLQIVDEAEERTAAFRMEIIVGFGDDLGSRQARDRRTNRPPSVGRRHRELKRWD